MTIKELKLEAQKLGYNIVKKPDKYIPCKCGANRRRWIWKDGYPGLKCCTCGLIFISNDKMVNESRMRKLWNDAMTKGDSE